MKKQRMKLTWNKSESSHKPNEKKHHGVPGGDTPGIYPPKTNSKRPEKKKDRETIRLPLKGGQQGDDFHEKFASGCFQEPLLERLKVTVFWGRGHPKWVSKTMDKQCKNQCTS